MKRVTLLDKQFRLSVSASQIKTIVNLMADRINEDFAGQEIVFVSVLNGSFVFAADLVRRIRLSAQIHFVKIVSYHGASSSGEPCTLIGLDPKCVEGKRVIILEDIVDSGLTIEHTVAMLKAYRPASVAVAALFFKPQRYHQNKLKIDYYGFEIPDRFIVGYGLDYCGEGRLFPDVYEEDKSV